MQHSFILLLLVLLIVGLIAISTQQVIKNCPPKPKERPVKGKCPTKIKARTTLVVDEYHCQKKANIYCCGPLVTDLSTCFTNPNKCRTDSILATRVCPARQTTCCCKGRVFGTFQQCNQRVGVQSKARRLYEEEQSEIPSEFAPCDDFGLATCHNTVDFENNNTLGDECYDSTSLNCTIDISDNVTQCVCASADIIDPPSSRAAMTNNRRQTVNAYRLCFFGQCFNNDLYYVPDATIPFIALRAPNPTVEKEDPGCAADIDGTYSGKPEGFKICSGVDLYVSEGCIWRKLPCPQSATLKSQCRPDVFEQAKCVIEDGRWFEPCVPVITGRTGCSAPLPDDLGCETDEPVCYGKDVLTCDDGVWIVTPCAGTTQCRGGACAPTDCLLYENCTVPGENLCGGTPCPFDQECCGEAKCYSPDTSVCLNDTVCPIGFLECDEECYMPGSRVCLGAVPENVLCIPTNSLCNGTCLNTTSQQCLDNVVCDNGLELCGDQCFNPATETCPSCADGELACGIVCYSPVTSMCIDGVLCPIGSKLCDGVCFPIESTCPTTTPPTPSPIPSPIVSPIPSPIPSFPPTCPEGEELCGSVCYSLELEVCLNETLCPVGNKLCGDVCFPESIPCPIICPPGNRPCNQTCYNPIAQICDHGILCPLSFFNCNGSCLPVNSTCAPNCTSPTTLCDTTCYNSDELDCTDGTICQFFQLSCNDICYNPVSQVCLNDATVICARGLSACGRRCYDADFQHCISGKICPLTYDLCGTNDAGTCYLDSEHDCCDGTTVCNPP
jgi:hypothetical protein